MQKQAQTTNGNTNVNYNGYPDRCPVCLHHIQPVDGGQPWAVPGKWLEWVFRCPSHACQRHFIARYTWAAHPTNVFEFSESVPLTVETHGHDQVVAGVSPDFEAVYKEAEEADLRNLKLVCGPGYRKALEFLIKDYVIKLNPEKAEEIKRMNLGECISDFVSSERIKHVASRAVWLGNDETHYLRRWGDKDLRDLKSLIKLTVHWIVMEELTAAVVRDMPQGK
jgi:hypothetical protein